MVETPTENKISLAFQNLSITSDKDYDDRFESIIKHFDLKFYLPSMKLGME